MSSPPLWVRVGLLVGLVAAQTAGGPAIHVEPHTRLVLTLHPLTAALAGEDEPQRRRLEIEPGQAAQVELDLVWPDPLSRSNLTLVARARETEEGLRVHLASDLELPSGRHIEATRTLAVGEPSTALFEVHRHAGRSLTLAVEARTETEAVLTTRPTLGPPVRFRIEIVRVIEGRTVSLEHNYLDTFIGEPISYAFRLGDTVPADAVRLTLKPSRLVGQLAEIDVEISGALPEEDELRVIARSERWLASRDATSNLAFESGDPPTGYRFLITARF